MLEETNKEAVNGLGNFRPCHTAVVWFLHLILNSQWI